MRRLSFALVAGPVLGNDHNGMGGRLVRQLSPALQARRFKVA